MAGNKGKVKAEAVSEIPGINRAGLRTSKYDDHIHHVVNTGKTLKLTGEANASSVRIRLTKLAGAGVIESEDQVTVVARDGAVYIAPGK